MSWNVHEMHDFAHVVPPGDLREHVLTMDCWCCPCCDDGVVIHNSRDQRELSECDHASA